MSYHIIYNKQFVKISDTEVIPMILSGDNNLWEMDNKSRVREWNCFANTFIISNEALIKMETDNRDSLKERNKGEYTDKQFGWYYGCAIYGKSTRTTTWGSYLNIFKTGIRDAMSIEQLREYNVYLSLSVSRYSKEKIINNGLDFKPEVFFETTEQIIETIKEYREYYKDVPVSLYLNMYGADNVLRKNKLEMIIEKNNKKHLVN